jgi:hypothetical protein
MVGRRSRAVPFFGQEIDVAVAKRGALTRVKTEAKIHSGAKPEFYRIYKFEQATDVGTKQRDGRRPRNQVYYQGERAKARALDHPRVGRHPPL